MVSCLYFFFEVLQKLLLRPLHLLYDVLVLVQLGRLSPERILLLELSDLFSDLRIVLLLEESSLVLLLVGAARLAAGVLIPLLSHELFLLSLGLQPPPKGGLLLSCLLLCGLGVISLYSIVDLLFALFHKLICQSILQLVLARQRLLSQGVLLLRCLDM